MLFTQFCDSIMQEIISGLGSQFHPDVVNAYLEFFKKEDVQSIPINKLVS